MSVQELSVGIWRTAEGCRADVYAKGRPRRDVLAPYFAWIVHRKGRSPELCLWSVTGECFADKMSESSRTARQGETVPPNPNNDIIGAWEPKFDQENLASDLSRASLGFSEGFSEGFAAGVAYADECIASIESGGSKPRAEPAVPQSDGVERAHATSVRLNQIRDAYYQLRYSQTHVDIVEDHIAALEAEDKRKKAWLNRAESELEKIELIKSTGMSFKGEMQHYVTLALLAVQAALAQTDGKGKQE